MVHPAERGRWMSIAIVAWLLSTVAAGAQSGPAFLSSAPVVVHARVAATRAAWDRTTGVIVTYVELDVLEDLGAVDLPPRVVLKQLGGEVDGIGMWIADQATFRAGEEALLYLSISRSDDARGPIPGGSRGGHAGMHDHGGAAEERRPGLRAGSYGRQQPGDDRDRHPAVAFSRMNHSCSPA